MSYNLRAFRGRRELLLSDYLSACAENDSKPLSADALEIHFKKLIASALN